MGMIQARINDGSLICPRCKAENSFKFLETATISTRVELRGGHLSIQPYDGNEFVDFENAHSARLECQECMGQCDLPANAPVAREG